MIDDDVSNGTNQLFSLLPSLNSSEKIIVHNQSLDTLTQIYTNKAMDCVTQWYKSRSVPHLAVLIKRGLLKIYKEKSIRMTTNNVSHWQCPNNEQSFVLLKKREIYAQLDKNGQILSSFDNRLFDSIEHFYQAYQQRRKRTENLAIIYESVYWCNQPFHDILLEYAEAM